MQKYHFFIIEKSKKHRKCPALILMLPTHRRQVDRFLITKKSIYNLKIKLYYPHARESANEGFTAHYFHERKLK